LIEQTFVILFVGEEQQKGQSLNYDESNFGSLLDYYYVHYDNI